MFGFGYSETINTELDVEEEESDLEDYESDFQKYLNNIDLDELTNIETSNYLDLKPESLFGDQNTIYQTLKDSIYNDSLLMQNVEKKINEMIEKINFYKSFLFDDEKRFSKIKENIFLLPKGYYLTAEEIKEKIKQNEHIIPLSKSIKNIPSNSNTKKTLDNLLYTGFNEFELTEFPGRLEAPQLLNSLSLKMNFKPSFLKYWTQIIRSDASCAILLDSFWWFYLTYFKRDTSLEADAYKFFCRIAESFAALLFNIDTSMRDRFFGKYADFLAQAIYLSFYYVVPDSVLHFNDNFKQEICNTVYEWILGIRPLPESYLNWKINKDLNISNGIDTKISSNSEILSKINNLEKLLNGLGERERESMVKFNDESFKNQPARFESKSSNDFSKSVELFYQKNSNESHVVGEGAVIEKLLFDLKGKSILINHYIKMHNIDSSNSGGFKMMRSEITRQSLKTAPTYRDLIYQSLERSKTMGDEYTKTKQEVENEVKRIEKQRKKAFNEFLRLKRSSSSGNLKSTRKRTSSDSNNKKRTHSLEISRIELIETDEENL